MSDTYFNDEITKKENEISNIIREDNGCSTYFTWHFKNAHPLPGSKIELEVHTFNPKHRTRFLLVKEINNTCDNEIETIQYTQLAIIKNVKKYLINRTKTNYNYLVEWNNKDTINEKIKRSYFNGETIDIVLEKLYNGRESFDFIIYKIEMIAES